MTTAYRSAKGARVATARPNQVQPPQPTPLLPRGVVVLIGLASAVLVIAGMTAAASLLGPLFLARRPGEQLAPAPRRQPGRPVTVDPESSDPESSDPESSSGLARLYRGRFQRVQERGGRWLRREADELRPQHGQFRRDVHAPGRRLSPRGW